MKNYDVNHFIEKFEKIPKEKWGTGSFKNGKKKCALGFCGSKTYLSLEALMLNDLTLTDLNESTVRINDNIRDLGNHPKERILNALYLIAAFKAHGYP